MRKENEAKTENIKNNLGYASSNQKKVNLAKKTKKNKLVGLFSLKTKASQPKNTLGSAFKRKSKPARLLKPSIKNQYLLIYFE